MWLLFLPTLSIRQQLWHLKASQTSIDRCHFSHSSSPNAFLFKILKLNAQPWSVTDYGHVTTPRLEGFVVVVQSPSHVRLFVTPWTAACLASLSLMLAQTHALWVNVAVPPLHPLSPLLLLPSIFSSIRVLSSESVLHIRRPKDWTFSFSVSPSKENSGFSLGWIGLISLESKGLSRVFSSLK